MTGACDLTRYFLWSWLVNSTSCHSTPHSTTIPLHPCVAVSSSIYPTFLCPNDSSFVRNLLNSGWLVLVFHLKAFYFIRHNAFILRLLLRVKWLQGRSASTLDGDCPLCACSLLVVPCFMELIPWLCLVFLFVLSEVHSLSQETRVSWFIPVTTFNHSYGSSLHRSVVSPPVLFAYSLAYREHGVSYVFILNYYSRWSIYPRLL